MVTLNPTDPLAPDFRQAIGSAISRFLDQRAADLAELGPELNQHVDLARAFTAGGKRLRPAFCCWGYLAATGGDEVPDEILRVAASLDVLHVAALIHDDVMDESDTRRGLPAAHVQFERRHREQGRCGSPSSFGRAEAILLGDLLLVWSAQLFAESGAPQRDKAAALAAKVREEVNAGQVLDVAAQTRSPWDARTDPESVMAQIQSVVEYKTARYTVIRPLQIGAALGGGSAELREQMARFGSPLGRAFQYRDDILGVFGDESVTGKPAGDDVREGKLTVLVAEAMARADEASAAQLAGLLGRPLSADQVSQAQQIIVNSGALHATEAQIEIGAEQALTALAAADLSSTARDGLARLVELSTQREA